MEEKTNKILALTLALFIIFTMFFSWDIITENSHATTGRKKRIEKKINEKKKEIDRGSKKLRKINKNLNKIEYDIEKNKKKVVSVKEDVDKAHKRVNKAKKDLKTQKKKIRKGEKSLNSRLRNIYKSGSLGFVDVILSSDDVSDLIFNIEMVQKIYKNDKGMVKKLKNHYKKLKIKKEYLSNMETSLKRDQKRLAAIQSKLSKYRAGLHSQKYRVSQMNVKLSKEVDDLQAEADSLTSEIKNYTDEGGKYRGGTMGWPVPGYSRIASPFGYRMCPFHGRELHTGIDIPAPLGTNVVAANRGVVAAAYFNASYGNVVIINHGGGIVTLYGHNSRLLVGAGDRVRRGSVIAKCGSTGNSTGPHCHFEVRVNGNYVNPMRYL